MAMRIQRAVSKGLLGVLLRMLTAVLAALLTAASTPAFAAADSGDSLKRAAEIASPSVVLINYRAMGFVTDNRDGSSNGPFTTSWWGSGFFVSHDGFIVTAAHVASPTPDYLKNVLVESYLGKDVREAGCEARGICTQWMDKYRAGYRVATSLSNVQATIHVFTQDMDPSTNPSGLPGEVRISSPLGQRDIAVVKINGENEPVLPVGDSSSVQIQDPVMVLGYPSTANTSLQTVLVPTVTKGSITAKKQGSQEIGLADGVNIFQTDATIEPGNSGGPAVNDQGQVVGLVSFGANSTNNFLITSSDIRDLVQQSGAHNSLGQIDNLWRTGLGYMDQHRYVKARAVLDQCVALNKVQVGCAAMSKKAAGLLSQDQEAKYAPKHTLPLGFIAAIGALMALALMGAGVAFVLVRRSGGPVAAPPAGQGALAHFAQQQAQPPQSWQQPHNSQEAPSQTAASDGAAVARDPVGFHQSATATLEAQPAVNRRFCSSCGNRVTPAQAYCAHCGSAQ